MTEQKQNLGYGRKCNRYASGKKQCFRCGQSPCECKSIGSLNAPKDVDKLAEKKDTPMTNKVLVKLRMEAKNLGINNVNSMSADQLKYAIQLKRTGEESTAEPTEEKPAQPSEAEELRAKLKAAGLKPHHKSGLDKLKAMAEENGIK